MTWKVEAINWDWKSKKNKKTKTELLWYYNRYIFSLISNSKKRFLKLFLNLILMKQKMLLILNFFHNLLVRYKN